MKINYPRHRRPVGKVKCDMCGEYFGLRGIVNHKKLVHGVVEKVVINKVIVPSKNNERVLSNDKVISNRDSKSNYQKNYDRIQEIIRELNRMVKAAQSKAEADCGVKERWGKYVDNSDRFQMLCRTMRELM